MKIPNQINKSSPVLIIGFGSIGKRHYRNLLSLGFTNVQVYDTDTKKLQNEGLVPSARPSPLTLSNFAVVLICNPTNLHATTALMAVKAGCHVFIEKPLSNKMAKLAELDHIARVTGRTVMIACNFRFHAGFVFFSKLVRSKKLGKPIIVRLINGHNISESRKGVDYRKTYAAIGKNGGGVILDVGAHVFDYLASVFGPVSEFSARYGNIGPLQIDAEDYAAIELGFATGVRGSVVLDYFSIPKRHTVEVECERGVIRWDFPGGYVEWYDRAQEKLNRKEFYAGMSKDEARNDMFVKELKYFFQVINQKQKPVSDVTHAREVTKTLLAIKKRGKKIKK